MNERRGVLVLGARNLGGAVAQRFCADGWAVAAVSRGEDSLAGVRGAGVHGITADAADPDGLRGAIGEARAVLGRLDVIVNAVSASRPPDDGTGFGGGALAEATLAGFEGWTIAPARQCFVFLSAGLEALGEGGALVQVTGGSARRANPGRGLWAAGCGAVRTLTHAAALEGKQRGIHVGLLIVDGVIGSPKTEAFTREMDADAIADQDAVADAAFTLATQRHGALTHELQVTPIGDRWVP